MKNQFDIAVVGAGPAGLMAAEVMAAAGHRITVYDAMPNPGRKLLVAGKGGLNLTNAEPMAEFILKYGESAPRFVTWLAAFPPEALRAWAKAKGVNTFVGSSGKVFPRDSGAGQLLTAWLQGLTRLGVDFHFGQRLVGLLPDQGLCFACQEGLKVTRHHDAALLALGGASWPQTGSDGTWAAWLEPQGVRVMPFRPANCGFEVGWSLFFRKRLAGTPLKNLKIFTESGASARGDAVITDYGIEGGPVYRLCSELRDRIEQQGRAILFLDLKQDLSAANIKDRLLSRRPSGQTMAARLRKALGLGWPLLTLVRECAPAADLADPGVLAGLIKKMPVTLLSPRPLTEAISTAGGIAMAEIDENCMLIRLPGLFAAGEMLDWEAPTGGYLLQGAFSTGVAAGHGILRWLARKA